jgi:hypothetical protein
MIHKKFDQQLHNKYDENAREATKKYIKANGHKAIDNPDIYGPDLIVEGLCYLECEVKTHWDKSYYPYPWVRIPYRKKKFTTLDLPTMFYIWNNKFTHGLRIRGTSFCLAEVKEYKNSKVPEGEYFFWFNPKTLKKVTING